MSARTSQQELHCRIVKTLPTVCKEAHLVCSQLVLEHQPNHFAWNLQQRQCDDAEAPDGSLPNTTESEAVVDVDHELLQKLPLLAGISNDVGRQHDEGTV